VSHAIASYPVIPFGRFCLDILLFLFLFAVLSYSYSGLADDNKHHSLTHSLTHSYSQRKLASAAASSATLDQAAHFCYMTLHYIHLPTLVFPSCLRVSFATSLGSQLYLGHPEAFVRFLIHFDTALSPFLRPQLPTIHALNYPLSRFAFYFNDQRGPFTQVRSGNLSFTQSNGIGSRYIAILKCAFLFRPLWRWALSTHLASMLRIVL
jgi:hypothetical protein